MAQSRTRLLEKTAQKLFENEERREGFIQSIIQPAFTSQALVWIKKRPAQNPFRCEERLPWQPACVDRILSEQRPGQSPFHEEGYFYVLDTSSVFSCVPLATLNAPRPVVIDVCASPGGKSVIVSKLLDPQLLVSNEVIRKRTAQLISNLKRCQIPNSMVISLDPKDLSVEISGLADVVVVDAPCSGQSLLAKGKKAEGCFHPLVIRQNMKRQRRVIANSASLLNSGGYLLYSTCTFSPEENEEVIEWFLNEDSSFSAVDVPALASHQSHLAQFPCYRLFPQEKIGAGAFTALLKKSGEGDSEDDSFLRLDQLLGLLRSRALFKS